MKLIVLLLTAAILQVSASSLAQKVTLKERSTPLAQVFTKISAQTGYDILYTTSLLKSAKPVTIAVTEANLNDVLKQIFANQPLEFSIEDKSVVISTKSRLPSWNGNVSSFVPITITGRVIDSISGKPLSGATLVIKGTDKGGRTNADGFFVFPGVEENATVIISYIGYQFKELPASKDMGVIALSPTISKLEEVGVTVNTGYQRIKPEQSTGAVSQLSTKRYESRISTSFLDGLVNRLPGLMINNDVNFTSTIPGGGSSSNPLFNIRGISTMSANQFPLIVIDGYPTELTLDQLDPNEIESVTILKDAAAATVYGVRASNGVIVITRKQATAGQARFNFRATTEIRPKEDYSRYRWAADGSSIAANYIRETQSSIVNANSWALLATNTATTGGNIGRSEVFYLLAQAAANIITPDQYASSFNALTNYNNIEDYSRLFLRTAVTNRYTFNVSGGSDKALYYITANYSGGWQNQILNDDNSIQLSGRTTLKFTNNFSLQLTSDYQELRDNGAPIPSPTAYSPFTRYQDANGNPLPVISSEVSPTYNTILMSQGLSDQRYYPLIEMNEVSDRSREVINRNTANFKYLIGGGFDLDFRGVYETSSRENRHLASEGSQEAINYVNSYVTRNADGTYKYNVPRGGFLRQQSASTTSFTTGAQLNFNRVIASSHSFNTILGVEVRKRIDKGFTTSTLGYNDETLLQQAIDYTSMINGTLRGAFGVGNPLGSQNDYDNLFNQQFVEDRFLSGYANALYSFKSTYSLSGSIRIDQSNLFGTDPKYKYKPFWSVGAAWNIHRENFMQNINWLNILKLRASYGFNGNVAKLSLPQVIAQSVVNAYTSPTSPSLGLLSYANRSLRWEQTKSVNIGLDFDIFKNINGTVEYYTKRSTDLLGTAQIDPTIGLSPTLVNSASISNRGIEFSLNADWIATKQTNWNTGITFAYNTSKVLDVFQQTDFGAQALNALGYVEGYPVGAMFSYRYAGLDSEGFPLTATIDGTKVRTNDSGIGNETAALMARGDASYYSGYSTPPIMTGLFNRVDVGNFYVMAMINYFGGFKVRKPRAIPSSNRPLQGAGDYWKVAGDENRTNLMSLAAYRSFNSISVAQAADVDVVSGDYLTLGDLTVSYNFNQFNFIRKVGIRQLELKAQASNLYTVGFNRENWSRAAGGFEKSYITPRYSLAIFTTF